MNRLTDKMRSVWSHFSPDSTPQVNKKQNQTSHKPNNLMYQLAVIHTAWPRAGSPSRWERKKGPLCAFVSYSPGQALERGASLIQPWWLLLCVQTAETDGNVNACVRWHVREAWPDLRHLAVNLICLEVLAAFIRCQLESRTNNGVKLASLFACSCLSFFFLSPATNVL